MSHSCARLWFANAILLIVLIPLPVSAGSLYVTSLGTDANAVMKGNATTSGTWAQLTGAVNGEAGGVVYDQAFSIDPTQPVSGFFDYYVGAGTGADGLSFFLMDASAAGWSADSVELGGVGSALGYSQRAENGVVDNGVTGGYLGIGLDEWGWFADATDGHDGLAGGGLRPNWISIRGCAGGDGNCTTGASATGYNYLAGVNSGLDLDGRGLPGVFWRVSFNFTPVSSTELLVSLGLQRRSNVDDNSQPITSVFSDQLIDAGGALPSQLAFGWAASTGMVNNAHSVGSFGLEYSDPQVPEPSTCLLFAGGLFALWRRYRRTA